MKHAGSLEVHTNRTMHRNIREDRIYIDGNTARKLQTVPTRRNTKQNDAIKRQQVRRRIKLSPMNFGYIFFMMVAMLVVCVVLIGYVELQADITNRINQISKLERQLNDLRLENDEIYTKIMSEVDLEEIKQIAKEFIYELLRENIRLKMFREFTDTKDVGLANQLADRTIVEYKAHPQARAVMHYCVETAEGEEAEYRTEEMNEVYGGVSFKDFVLFFGERLQYYIMEQRDGSEQLTESATIQKSDAGGNGTEGKFNLINDLSISTTLQDYETVDKLLAEYEYQEFMKNGLFKLR